MIRLAVIGDPIEHSLSPAVHGAALNRLGIEYEYKKVLVHPENLGEFVKTARAGGYDGFNLTMPHKVNILPYLSQTDEEAQYYSAVNTVCVRDGELYGFNTDGIGYELALGRMGKRFRGSRLVVLGAGGAAAAVIAAAIRGGAESISVACRTAAHAEKICDRDTGDTKVKICGFSDTEIAAECKGAEVLINATPLGMEGVAHNFDGFDFLDALPQEALVSDLIYKPNKTKLLAEAEARGLKTQNGLDMLIFQAIAADERYLDRKLDVQDLYKTVIDAVKDR